MNASTAALGNLFGTVQIVGSLTLDRSKKEAEHVSTSEVATDMLGIVKAYGMDKLQYWGVS
jgi:hypothetical protein